MTAPRPHGPLRVLPASQRWPLFDMAASRAIEARALAQHAPGVLMQRAGHSVARLALALAPHAQRIWIAAGPGGNGGDGLHAAAELAARGRRVVVTLCADPERLPVDARHGLQRARAAGVHVGTAWPEGDVDLSIDALLGLGASRAPEGAIAEAIGRLHALSAPCLAIDLPSGLAADTGAPLGTPAVEADATLSLLTLKPGLFTGAGRDHAGTVWLDDLGSTDAVGIAPSAVLGSAADLAAARVRRRHAQHKGSFGDVVVVGGAAGMAGAARLAAHGALGAGAGRTIVSLLDPETAPGDLTRPEWLWWHDVWRSGQADLDRATVVCGCGGGDAVRSALPALLSRARALVLDADALNAVATDAPLQDLLRARAARGRATVLTPHPLEAARLMGATTAEIQRDRLASARALSDRTGAVVVLKGSGTVITSPGLVTIVNSNGSAALASGGTGDVLAGWIGGLWAQRPDHDDPFEAALACAAAAVWCHGAAADQAPGHAVRARDLVDAMRSVATATAP